MRNRSLQRVIAVLAGLFALLALLPSSAGADPLDYDLPDGSGHFYKQANGQGGRGETGFSITNADGIRFWDEYRRHGGWSALGYPVSRRFVWDGFTVQAMQKVVLQWRPETQSVAFVNVFDRMHDLGKDAWLEAFRATPPPFDTAPDQGLTWEQVKARHWALLDQFPAIKRSYWSNSDPLQIYGLPMSVREYANVSVVRAQRAVFQQWKDDMPWAAKGQVTIANGGDLAKEAGLFPGAAVTPEATPSASKPIAPPCPVVPVRGFGAVWAEHPEVYDLLGCPGWPTQEQAVDVVVQRFEHGWMLRVQPPPTGAPWSPIAGPQIYALFEDNQTLTAFPDTWSAEKDPVSTGLVPPSGMFEPTRGFGKVWREGTGVKTRQRLGWATGLEQSGSGAWQMFQRGRMVWTPDPRLVFVLAERTPNGEVLNTWRVYADAFAE